MDTVSNAPEFTVGDRVKAVEFTDCFGKFHAAEHGLCITEVRLVDRTSNTPYYRYVAEREHGDGPYAGCVEGAARYFAREHSQDSDCTLDANDLCVVCRVYHGDPCVECHARGYHDAKCAFVNERGMGVQS